MLRVKPVVDVELIHPPVDVAAIAGGKQPSSEYPLMPMGLFSIADYLDRLGVEVKVTNLALERLTHPYAPLRKLLAKPEAKIVAISLHWFVHTYGALETAKLVKALNPDAKVVLGGFTASFFAREILERYSYIDAVVLGEGEETMLELAQSERWNEVMGVATREGRKVRWTEREPVNDLEKYCFTNVEIYDKWQVYLKCSPSGYSPTRRPSFWLPVARSCPMNCAYCGGGLEGYKAAMGRSRPIVRSPGRLAEDVSTLVGEYKVEVVKLSHDPLIWGEHYYVELMEEISRRGVDAKAYWDLTYLPGEELVRKALRAFEGGICWGLSIETTNDRVRLGIGRPYAMADIERFLPIAQKHDVTLDAYFLVGLPWSTKEDVNNDMKYAVEVMRKYRNVYVVPPFPYTMDPHAPMALRPRDYGLRKICSSVECYRRLVKSEKWEDWVVHESEYLTRKEIASLTSKFFKMLVEAYRSGEFNENISRRYSFEHEGILVEPFRWWG